MKKKGNAAAVLIIIMLIVLSLGVLLYDPYIEEEFSLHYGKIYTESVARVERSYFDGYQSLTLNGLNLFGGSWYFNAGYNLTQEDIKNSIIEQIKSLIMARDYYDGDVKVRIRNLDDISVSIDNDFVEINITKGIIEIETAEEQRIIEFSDEFRIASDISKLAPIFNGWLSCDAGNLTNKFIEHYKNEVTCKFSDCCCSGMEETDWKLQINNRIREYGITQNNIEVVFNQSLDVLNKMIAHNNSDCSNLEEPLEGYTYTCKIVEFSTLEIDHKYDFLMDFNSECNKTHESNRACTMLPTQGNPNNHHDDKIYLWNKTREGLPVISFAEAKTSHRLHNLQSLLHHNPGFDNYEDIRGEPSEKHVLHSFSINNGASGIIKIECDNIGTERSYEKISFKMKFKHQHRCGVLQDSTGLKEMNCTIPLPPPIDPPPGGCPICEVWDGVAGECVPAPDGEPCGHSEDCKDSYCLDGQCTLVPVPGGTCTHPDPCIKGICDDQGNCIQDDFIEGVICGEGTDCEKEICDDQGNCILTPEPDITCPVDNPCAVGICTVDGECIEDELLDGISCGEGTQCMDLLCEQGVCTEIPLENNLCDHANPCLFGICNEHGACVKKNNKHDRTSCGGTTACKEEICLSGVCTNADKADGTPCDTSNVCSEAECISGNCVKEPSGFLGSCNTGNPDYCMKWGCVGFNCQMIPDEGGDCGEGTCAGKCDSSGNCNTQGNPCTGPYKTCIFDSTCTNQGLCRFIDSVQADKDCCAVDGWCNNDCCGNFCCANNSVCCGGVCCASGLICCGEEYGDPECGVVGCPGAG